MNLTFGEIKTLYSAPTSPLVTRIAALGDKVYLVCNEDGSTVRNVPDAPADRTLQDQIDARSTIRCGISLDGEHFGDVNVLYQANVAQHMPPAIVASNGKCFLAWGDGNSDMTEPVVLFSKSRDDNSGFEDPLRLNPSFGGAKSSLVKPSEEGPTWDANRRELFRRWYLVPRVKLAAAGSNVYVFWTETTARLDTDAEYKLYFRASNDCGYTFGEKKHLGTMTVNSKEFMRMFHINLTASGDEVYLMWVQFTPVPGYMFSGSINPLEAHIALSRDGGRSIEKIVNLSSETDLVRGDSPSRDDRENAGEPRRRPVVERLPLDIVATGNGNLGMVLIGHENHNPMDFAKNMMQPASNFARSKAGTGINSAEVFDINLPVFFARSTDYGSFFSHPVLLADYSAGIDDTYLICDSNRIYVLWQAVLQNGAMLVRRSADGGQTFTKQAEIPGVNMFHPMGHPVYNGSMVLTQGGNLLGAIRSDVKSPTGEPQDAGSEVIFAAIDKSGATVESRKLSEGGAQVAIFPSVASAGTNVYVAWSETSKSMPTSIKFRKAIVNNEP